MAGVEYAVAAVEAVVVHRHGEQRWVGDDSTQRGRVPCEDAGGGARRQRTAEARERLLGGEQRELHPVGVRNPRSGFKSAQHVELATR
eukprot:1075755-Prymnesium_polylepis.1